MLSPSEFYELMHKHRIYDEIESHPDKQFEVQIDEPALELHQVIAIYKKWLEKAIHEYYTHKTGKYVRKDRKSRREFGRFMDDHNVKVRKERDDLNFWELIAGDDEHPKVLTTLLIKNVEPPEERTN